MGYQKFEGENMLLDIDTSNLQYRIAYIFGINFIAISVGDYILINDTTLQLTTNKFVISKNKSWIYNLYTSTQKRVLFFELDYHIVIKSIKSLETNLPVDFGIVQNNIIPDFEDSLLNNYGLKVTRIAKSFGSYIIPIFDTSTIASQFCKVFCNGIVTNIKSSGEFYNITVLHGSSISFIKNLQNILISKSEYITPLTPLGRFTDNSIYYIMGAGLIKL